MLVKKLDGFRVEAVGVIPWEGDSGHRINFIHVRLEQIDDDADLYRKYFLGFGK